MNHSIYPHWEYLIILINVFLQSMFSEISKTKLKKVHLWLRRLLKKLKKLWFLKNMILKLEKRHNLCTQLWNFTTTLMKIWINRLIKWLINIKLSENNFLKISKKISLIHQQDPLKLWKNTTIIGKEEYTMHWSKWLLELCFHSKILSNNHH
jgi:hypothetical protein